VSRKQSSLSPSSVARRGFAEVIDATGRVVTGVPASLVELELELGRERRSAAREAPCAKALQNMPGHESAGLTFDRRDHLHGSDVEAAGVAINALLALNYGQYVVTRTDSVPTLLKPNTALSADSMSGA
jgi:hypothetical protein